jgi:hypothetical protein
MLVGYRLTINSGFIKMRVYNSNAVNNMAVRKKCNTGIKSQEDAEQETTE